MHACRSTLEDPTYSLGVLLYELLTGRPPFDPKTLVDGGLDQICRIIREVEPPRPSTRLSTLGHEERTTLARQRSTAPAQLALTLRGDLDWIVMKALEKNRVRRYESASALAADVQRFLGHEPVVARPPSPGYLLGKFVRRHRVAFTAATVVFGVVALGAVVSTWQAVRATRAEREQVRLRATESELRAQAEAQALAMRRQSYASDMNLVQQALASHNLGRAQELLDRQRPRAGELDLRGWEWRYLWQFCQDQASWVLSNGSVATQVSVSSDGHWLATGGPKPGLWNLRTRQPAAIPRIAEGDLAVAQFSPTEPLLAISSWTPGKPTGARLTLWNLARQEAVHEWPLERPFHSLVFCGDGKTLVTMQGSEVVLRRVPTGERLARITKFTFGDIAFSHDGRLAAKQDVAGTVRLIDVATGRERGTIKASAESTAALAFSPDGATLATAGGGADSAIRLWEVSTGNETGRLEGHRAYARSLVFWPDGRTLASAAQDQTIRIWDLNTRQLSRTLHGHQRALLGLALMPDHATLVSTSSDSTLRFWDTTTSAAVPASSQLGSPVMRWAFTPDSQAVITVDRKGVVRRWHGRDFGRSNELATIAAPFTRTEPPEIRTVCLPSRGELVAVTSAQGVVQIWNWARGAMERELAAPATRAFPVAFIDGEKKLLVDCFAPSGQQSGLFEWDLATGQQTRSWPRRAMPAEYSVSPDGKHCLVRVAVRSDAAPVSVSRIDLVSGAEVPIAGAPWLPEQGRFSPDGRLFASPTGPTGTIYATTSFEPVRTLTATMHGMFGAAFSPDGGRLAFTMSGFEAVRLWDTGNWEQVLTLDAGASRLWNSAFSPDGNVLGSMSYWGTVHFWRAPSWAEIAAAETKSR